MVFLRPQVHSFHPHRMFSPGGYRFFALETLSKRGEGVEECCKMLQAALRLNWGGREGGTGRFRAKMVAKIGRSLR